MLYDPNQPGTVDKDDLGMAMDLDSIDSDAGKKKGNLKEVLREFGHLKHHCKGHIVVDTRVPCFGGHKAQKFEWEQFYPGVSEELPPDIPQPKGKVCYVSGYFDAENAHSQETRRSLTGIICLHR